ncbi:YIP1 family protein [Patescibacteria group bacterium]|nr:YIP1 family protein [Patescibacteria group bacterium]MCL5798291.1 YIP1 family protein [Patescibacteria group bacterium]
MDVFVITFVRLLFFFTKNLIGCFNTPYLTYRKLLGEKSGIYQTGFIFILVISYFIFASALRVGVHSPLLLTLRLNLLLFSAAIGFIAMLFVIFMLGKTIGSSGRFIDVYKLWSFTLIPTIVWFFTTSLLYIIIPPPRTLSFLGKLFSVVFIAFSVSVFLWKAILYYLTLRFALRLDLAKIGFMTVVILPLLVVYSVLMYKLGIFRVPFI